ncbi:MAG: hypothetical protein ACERIH_11900 [Labilibaculum antarcticum]
MKKHKKHTNKQIYQSGSTKAYLIFEKRLIDLLTILLDREPPLDLLSDHEKALMFGILYHVKTPRRAENNMITTKELRYINKIYQQMLRKDDLIFGDLLLSVIDYNVFAVFHYVIENVIDDKERQGMLKKAFEIPDNMEVDKCVGDARMYYLFTFYKVMTRVGNVRKKFYFYKMTPVKNQDGSDSTRFLPVVSACCSVQKKLEINKRLRPVFKMGVPDAVEGFRWVKIKKTLLGDYYKDDEGYLDMYIQSHALNRMKERLDVFDKMTLNHILCLNVSDVTEFEHYRGYLLLPLLVYSLKIGYFVCNVLDNKLVVRSFLFVTHSFTPEGDKLKEITGLKRLDISYWKIDRLSTLMQIDEAYQPQLLLLFQEVGIQDIMKLKGYDLDIETMQNANMDDFLDYLKQSEVELPELTKEVLEKEKTMLENLREKWHENKLFFVLAVFIALFAIPILYIIRKIKGISAPASSR